MRERRSGREQSVDSIRSRNGATALHYQLRRSFEMQQWNYYCVDLTLGDVVVHGIELINMLDFEVVQVLSSSVFISSREFKCIINRRFHRNPRRRPPPQLFSRGVAQLRSRRYPKTEPIDSAR